MPAAKSELDKLFESVVKFVKKRRGKWEHADWEAFVAQVEQIGYPAGDELKRNLGNMLEAAKYFYLQMPPAPAKRKSAPRRKAAPKKPAAE